MNHPIRKNQLPIVVSDVCTSFLSRQLRNAVFAVVAQRAIRRVARDVFEHLHDLDMSYHLAKNTGAVSRVLDRGGDGDEVYRILTA